MRKTKERGITLIALVITIIVMLILAGVTISIVVNGGLFQQAQKATQEWKRAQQDEMEQLLYAESLMNSYASSIKSDGSWNGEVNTPKLLSGMVPVAWNESGAYVPKTAEEWYDYDNQKWANAITKDGSYWVWIPRYAYQITSQYHTSGSAGGTINIEFLEGTTNKGSGSDGKAADGIDIVTDYTGITATTGAGMDKYVVHPAFQDGSTNGKANNYKNGEWGEELEGFWVAKYAAGYQDVGGEVKSGEKYTSNGYNKNIYGTLIAGVTEMTYPVFKADKYTYNCITVGDSYTLSRKIAEASEVYGLTGADSHLMKNSEWGAVAYLSRSTAYGRAGAEIEMNNKNLQNGVQSADGSNQPANIYSKTGYGENSETVNKVEASTTKNMTGVFDLRGGVWERTAAYRAGDGNNDANTANINYVQGMGVALDSARTASTPHLTIYPATYDESNPKATTPGIYGDAVWETSQSGYDNTSWFTNYSVFVSSAYPAFSRRR